LRRWTLSRIQTRLDQGWVNLVLDDLDEVFSSREEASGENAASVSIAYHGNIVDLLEYACAEFHPSTSQRPDLLPQRLQRRLLSGRG
jgi:urocanate hydratase